MLALIERRSPMHAIRRSGRLVSVIALLPLLTEPAIAEPDASRTALLARFIAAAQATEPSFVVSAARGEVLFRTPSTAGKADTPSCTSCHTDDPTRPGRTRAGKTIEPLAPSAAPTRLVDEATVDKWLRRNCSDVLGRDCSAAEKADLLAFLVIL